MQARQAYIAGDVEKCGEILRRESAAGDPNCQTFLGTLYQDGLPGFDKDVWRAVKLYEQAAEQQNLLGTYMLGQTYFRGLGVKRDKKKGARLIKRAALMNLPEAQAMLYEVFRRPFRRKVATAWLLVAAENGDQQSVERLQGARVSNGSREIAGRILNLIKSLHLLKTLNPVAGLKRLDELELEDIR